MTENPAAAKTAAVKATGVNFASRGSINVRLGENVNLESLQSIIARIAHLSGCTACGLLGVDVHIGGDPVEFKQVSSLPGVAAVSFE